MQLSVLTSYCTKHDFQSKMQRVFMHNRVFLYVYSTPPLTIRPQLILLSRHSWEQLLQQSPHPSMQPLHPALRSSSVLSLQDTSQYNHLELEIHAIGDKVCFSSISFLEIILHALAQNDDPVRIFHGIFFALTNKFGAKTRLPFLALPVDAMDGNNNSFSKHLRQPCKERRLFGMDVHHIVFSKCTIKCRKCGGADCSKSP